MDVLKLSLLCLLFPLLCKAAYNCPKSFCGNNNFAIQFPFHFKDDFQRPNAVINCSYPGFTLRCNNLGDVVLNLPNSGDFYVKNIDYRGQVIQLSDPSGCLAGRLLGLNLSSSPFDYSYTQNYTYLSCPLRVTLGLSDRIHCLSNFSTWTIATLSTGLVTELTNQNLCQIIAFVQVPVLQSVQYDKRFSSTLSQDLYLEWNTPNCKDCDAQTSTCGFSNSKQHTQCYDDTGETGTDHELIKIIVLSLAAPTLTFSVIICSVCVSRGRGANGNNRQQNLSVAAVTPAETRPVTLAGLDESIIESYPNVVLGESKRVPGLNAVTCPICLSDYNAKEMVKCIPECKHCFHAECIDEWLRLNGTCPVCRNFPSPVYAHS